jgi:hypothetical protein
MRLALGELFWRVAFGMVRAFVGLDRAEALRLIYCKFVSGIAPSVIDVETGWAQVKDETKGKGVVHTVFLAD